MPAMNENRKKLYDLCIEKKIKVRNTFHEDVHKFTWINEEHGSKRLLNFVSMKEENGERLLRGAWMGIYNQCLVMFKIRCLREWVREGGRVDRIVKRSVMRSSELKKVTYKMTLKINWITERRG